MTTVRQESRSARCAAPAKMALCLVSTSAAAGALYASLARLHLEQGFRRVDVMSAREIGEAFLRACAVGEIGLEYPFDCRRRIVGFDVAIDLAAALRLRTKAAADMDVIGLGLILVVGALGLANLGAKKPDIADVMLRAGIRATGEMNVERGIERHAAFAPLRDRFGVPLGIGHRQAATGIAGAGDETGADRGCFGR